MNDATRKGMRIAVAAVVAIMLVVGALLAWLDISANTSRQRVEAEVSALCESVPLGADRSFLLRQAAARGIALWRDPDGATYTYGRQWAAYNEISCEFKLDASGTVVAHTFRPVSGTRIRRAASAASVSG